MNNKLKKILLIDDNKTTNFLHEYILKKEGIVDKIVSVISGYDALDYLKTPVNGVYPIPDIIFLDINMPGINGWEFIEEYNKLPEELKANRIIIMLTTSLNPNDKEKANEAKEVNGFINKPLTSDKIKKILEKHFPDLK